MRRATIREVARRAGVSYQTVSRVINNHPMVAASTRALVRQAIAELDYHPNAQAVGLSRNRADIVGVITHSIASPFFAQIVDGTAQALQERGRFMLLGSAGMSTQLETIDSLQRSRRIDGMIIILPLSTSLEAAQQLAASQFPLVLVDLQYDIDANHISIDNRQGAYCATEHLIGLGHRRIGLISGPLIQPVAHVRIAGYKDALRAHGLPYEPELVVIGDFANSGGEAGATHFLSLDDPPTAIFACNDQMAFGTVRTLRRRGLRVPDDISVIGFDDIAEASISYPPLTTMRQPLAEMGRIAAEYVCRVIDGEATERLQVTLSTELIVRQSTAPLRERSLAAD
ncbi:MAG TPA: LacI family DNA-binding transcriptional regulator [Roseiflexaceae bacterium]|nr:LacI family DNA-binding transcriptional regulator [Roseiflexaceae bacterium]